MPAEVDIDVKLVRRLVATQFPVWAELEIRPVANGGWDNRTFHLGSTMSVRLPSAEPYAAQVAKEQLWLPRLAPQLPLPIPEPLACGGPGEGYPWAWSVYRWLPGAAATVAGLRDLDQFARDLAGFLDALQRADTAGGPPAGQHNFFRGGDLSVYDTQMHESLTVLAGTLDTHPVRRVWEAALASRWSKAPVWLHGDMAAGNLLLRDGRLSAVIDFGCSATGDPACDLAIAWTFLDEPAARIFRESLTLDDATWMRGAGWTLWKALLEIRRLQERRPEEASRWRSIVSRVLADVGS